jgi:hypothetical protein
VHRQGATNLIFSVTNKKKCIRLAHPPILQHVSYLRSEIFFVNFQMKIQQNVDRING